MEERVITLSLRKVYKKPRKKRARRAIREIRKLIMRFVKAISVKISPKLNEVIWKRAEKPPRKVRLR